VIRYTIVKHFIQKYRDFIFVSPEKATYRYYFCRRRPRRRPRRLACPERNFVIIGLNDSKLGMHASGNDLKCSTQEP